MARHPACVAAALAFALPCAIALPHPSERTQFTQGWRQHHSSSVEKMRRRNSEAGSGERDNSGYNADSNDGYFSDDYGGGSDSIVRPWLTPASNLYPYDNLATFGTTANINNKQTLRQNENGYENAEDRDSAEAVAHGTNSTRNSCSQRCAVAAAVPTILIAALLFTYWRIRKARSNLGGEGQLLKQVRLDVVRNPLRRLKNSFKGSNATSSSTRSGTSAVADIVDGCGNGSIFNGRHTNHQTMSAPSAGTAVLRMASSSLTLGGDTSTSTMDGGVAGDSGEERCSRCNSKLKWCICNEQKRISAVTTVDVNITHAPPAASNASATAPVTAPSPAPAHAPMHVPTRASVPAASLPPTRDPDAAAIAAAAIAAVSSGSAAFKPPCPSPPPPGHPAQPPAALVASDSKTLTTPSNAGTGVSDGHAGAIHEMIKGVVPMRTHRSSTTTSTLSDVGAGDVLVALPEGSRYSIASTTTTASTMAADGEQEHEQEQEQEHEHEQEQEHEHEDHGHDRDSRRDTLALDDDFLMMMVRVTVLLSRNCAPCLEMSGDRVPAQPRPPSGCCPLGSGCTAPPKIYIYNPKMLTCNILMPITS